MKNEQGRPKGEHLVDCKDFVKPQDKRVTIARTGKNFTGDVKEIVILDWEPPQPLIQNDDFDMNLELEMMMDFE